MYHHLNKRGSQTKYIFCLDSYHEILSSVKFKVIRHYHSSACLARGGNFTKGRWSEPHIPDNTQHQSHGKNMQQEHA